MLALRLAVLWSSSLLALVAGCDGDEISHHPGPCSAVTVYEGFDQSTTHAWSYDDAGRMVRFVSEASLWDDTVTFTYEGETLVEVYGDPNVQGEGSDMKRFTFGDPVELQLVNSDAITVERDATYDPAGFQFLGHPVQPVLDAPDAALWSHTVVTNVDGEEPVVLSDTEITYTYDGPPRQGTRTRTGSDGTSVAFSYDDDGRLTAYATTTYVYDGALLTEIRNGAGAITFEYDGGDNLVRRIEGPATTTYQYECW